MSHIDIILDMVIGSLKDERKEDDGSSSSTTSYTDLYKLEKNGMILKWQQIRAMKTTLLSNVFCSKLFCGKVTNMKHSTPKYHTNESNTLLFKIPKFNKKIKKIKNYLKDRFKKEHLNDCELTKYAVYPNNIDFNDLEVNTVKTINYEKECDDNNNSKIKGQEKNKDNTNNLELFFQSMIKLTKEFNDEEILDLQMQILKCIKTIKGKRELKQNLRRYCVASMNFKDFLIKPNE